MEGLMQIDAASDLAVKDRKAIPQTLFRGNDYWFCMGTDVDRARVTVHVYDSNGKLADSDAWQKGWFAAARGFYPYNSQVICYC
jgi:hypothetical protein